MHTHTPYTMCILIHHTPCAYSYTTLIHWLVQGVTLMKNIGNTLPLSPHSTGTAAVLGPMAFSPNTGDNVAKYYGPLVQCGQWPNNQAFVGRVTVIDAIETVLGSTHVTNCTGTGSKSPASKYNSTAVAEAVALAKAADVTIVVIGE
jgi:hypothetical protein